MLVFSYIRIKEGVGYFLRLAFKLIALTSGCLNCLSLCSQIGLLHLITLCSLSLKHRGEKLCSYRTRQSALGMVIL